MTLSEIYNLPEGANPSFRYFPLFFDNVPEDFPCPSSMEGAFRNYGGVFVKRLDVSNVTTMKDMFIYASGLINIDGIENWNTSNVTNMNAMFSGCNNLIFDKTFNWDTSKVTDMYSMFANCKKLTELDMTNWDTSKVTDMSSIFSSCDNLTSIGALRCDSLSMASYQSFFGYPGPLKLTHMGGLINLKTSITGTYNLDSAPNLTYESCINILNGLYDFAGNGETPSATQGQLKVHKNFLDKVGDEISIGTLKGWKITV